ncbi:winged helix-turn-helix domain-containing protein [Salinarchaeum chitinilyticum]
MSELQQNTDETDHPDDERGSTGWLVLARHESVAKIVDALLDRPPHSQFTQTELAAAADVSRQSVSRHLDLLLEIGVLEPVEGSSPQRYSFDPHCEVSEAIVRLDGAMNAAGPGPDGA